MSFVYLAGPYSHKDEAVRLERYDQLTHCTSLIMAEGIPVFSPITHSHNAAAYLPQHLLMNHGFWMQQDLPVLRRAAVLTVVQLPGWTTSLGVKAEIEEARRVGLPVVYIEEFYKPPIEALRWELQKLERPPAARAGRNHVNAKLDEDAVRVARARYARGEHVKQLARAYGVAPKTMRNALDGFTWKHVE